MTTLWDNRTEDADFDAKNPGVYSAFVAQAEAVLARGFDHYSARTIIHFLRHHSLVTDGSAEFKINDHISPYLARRLMREDARFAGFFETRRSADDAA